ncbi:lytic transglycosylase domain-containing protein [Pseudoxanthomonas dokdonensis]|uniref:LysM domain-containing protein n=1 Tax=Pseudoxanthomonas dokdonensis TaxID=344882 RepID=A0A0R0CPF6_9GAMM|nr:hypothetical protein ABB29_15060 [Pseudoxanthomonas dokdonensis]
MRRALVALGLAFACPTSLLAAPATTQPGIEPTTTDVAAPAALTGLDIYQHFEEGLAEPVCAPPVKGGVWRKHFRQAPARLAREDDDLLPLFGYVVDAVRDANLPTEYALIPFVESGYKPAARSSAGPAGLWQFISLTARNHGVPVGKQYDGRLSPVDSTQAAVRYLKTLHGMFGGDWRLAVMAYNAGEYRVLQSMRRAGMNAQNARPAELPGLSKITYAYVQKLQALSCLLQQAGEREEWSQQLNRTVPQLVAQPLPANVSSLQAWAAAQQQDAGFLSRINPALKERIPAGKPIRVLAEAGPANSPVAGSPALATAMAGAAVTPAAADNASAAVAAATTVAASSAGASTTSNRRSHTVSPGESVWLIARRYGMKPSQLLTRNGLSASSVLRPGMVLALDDLN